MAQKWDSDALSAEIKRSQRSCRLILKAYAHRPKPRWNHEERPDESVLWYRGEGSYNDWVFAHLPVAKES